MAIDFYVCTCFNLSLSRVTVSPSSCISIPPRLFFTLSMHLCIRLPNDLLPLGYRFWTTFIIPLDMWPALQFFYISIPTAPVSGSLCYCCDSILFVISYYRVKLLLFSPYIILGVLLSRTAIFSSSLFVVGACLACV